MSKKVEKVEPLPPRTLGQIGAELGSFEHGQSVAPKCRHSMRSAGTAAHPAFTQQIVELRDQGLTWNEDGRTAGYNSFRRLEPLAEGQATKATTLGPLAAGSRQRA